MARAKALTMLGAPLSSAEAESMGLIHLASREDEFDNDVNRLSQTLANMPTKGLGMTKKAFHAGLTNSLEEQLSLELDLQFQAAETSDYAEGVAAFLEKRAPKFKGQ